MYLSIGKANTPHIGQASTPDSASFVMRKLLQQLGLQTVDITADLGSGGMTFGERSPFRVDNIRKREMSRGDSDARKKSAGLADITPAESFNFAREVRETSTSLSVRSSEAVRGMTASLFNDKSPYALKLGNEPVMREAVSSLFALINDYVPSNTKTKDRSDWKWWEKMTPCFGTRAWRDDALANLGYDRAGHFRETILQAFVLVEVSKEIRPKEISRRQAGLKAKPGIARSPLVFSLQQGGSMLDSAYRWLNPRWCIWCLNHWLKGTSLIMVCMRYCQNEKSPSQGRCW